MSSRHRNAFPRIAVMGCALLLAAAVPRPAQVQASAPTLSFATAPGHQLAVIGHGWPRNAVVTFAVRYSGRWTQGRELVTTASGGFTVALDTINLCGGSLFTARDFKGNRASLSGPALMCPTPLNPPRPALTIVNGTPAHPHQVRVVGVGTKRQVSMRVGDTLYFWEAGSSPSFTPRAGGRYLFLLRQGATPPSMCPQVTCQQGLFWVWAALRPGATSITFSAQCRLSTPPCELPDFLLEVRIRP
jgi:hypothetical protein